MRGLVVTADDFGLDVAVNEAVEEAHRRGILTAAGLMMGQPATRDAVARARRLPTLAVGLHLAVTSAWPQLPPPEVAHLVERDGTLTGRLVPLALKLLWPAWAREMVQEIEAQLRAFAATGLSLDHVSVHQHMHLHPVVLAAVLRLGPAYGMRALRVPHEPAWIARTWQVPLPWMERGITWPWLGRMARLARRANVAYPVAVFGRARSGHLDEEHLVALIPHLPPGISEVYLHPATIPAHESPVLARFQPGYRGDVELRALLGPRVRQALAAHGVRLGSYRDLLLSRTFLVDQRAPRE